MGIKKININISNCKNVLMKVILCFLITLFMISYISADISGSLFVILLTLKLVAVITLSWFSVCLSFIIFCLSISLYLAIYVLINLIEW